MTRWNGVGRQANS